MIRYRLDDLGWFQFEWLCQSLLKYSYGVRVEAWGGHSDLGRDAYCPSSLDFPDKGKSQDGPFVFQAKFVQNANSPGANPDASLKNAVNAEAREIQRKYISRDIGSIKHYVLMTNVPLSPDLRTFIKRTIKSVAAHLEVTALGAQDLCALLDKAPELRVSFPQILSIADLQHLIASTANKSAIERSKSTIELAREANIVFVPTSSYSDMLNILSRYYFAVLTGPPEMGKTTNARMIGLAKVGEGWECIVCRRPEEFDALHAPNRPQIFLADDAFGSTEYRSDLGQAWGDELERIIRKLDATHWMIWTSRPVPLQIALSKMHLDGKAKRFPEPGAVQVDVSRLSSTEKQLILYRHAKSVGLEPAARTLVKNHYRVVCENPHFTPERVKRFVNIDLPTIASQHLTMADSIQVTMRAIKDQMEKPTEAMTKSFRNLSPERQLFLISLLDSRNQTVEETEDAFCRHSDGQFSTSIISSELLGHFITTIAGPPSPLYPSGWNAYAWMHPSWRDLVIDMLASSQKERRRFLAKCGIEGITLAISSAGGESGTRQMPLLYSSEDWLALQISIIREIKSLDLKQLWSLLNAIKEAAERILGQDSESLSHHRESIHYLLTTVSTEIRQRWTLDKSIRSIRMVMMYYRLTEWLHPSPEGLDLSSIWTDAWEAAQDDVQQGKWPTGKSLNEWLDFVAFLQEQEPRYLRRVGFPSKQIAILQPFVEYYSNIYSLDFDPDSKDAYVTLIEECTTLEECFSGIEALIPPLERDGGQAAVNLKHERQKLEEALSDRYPEPDSDDRDDDDYDPTDYATRDLFADL